MADNASGFAALDAHIERVERLRTLARDAAPEVARELDVELRRQITAGTDPDGKPWPARKDGGKPLESAGKALGVGAVGTTIIFRLRGHIARHHKGLVKGGLARRILPVAKVPDAMASVIKRVLARRFREATDAR